VVKQYSKLETTIPPIVIGSNGYIIDGTHRAGAAKQKGDTTIKAFVGI
jgi:ParB-like chromosome segregation protein Spo0J